MQTKLVVLLPILGLIALESFIDTHFLLKFKPEPTTCCTSIFDVPRPGIQEMLTWDSWWFVVVFYVSLCLLIGVSIIINQRESINISGKLRLGSLFLVIWTPISFLLALHTKISPVFLQAPFHHCVFCLWQRSADSILSTILVVGGAWLMASYLSIISLKNYHYVRFQLEDRMQRIFKYALLMLITSGGLLGAHLIIGVGG